MMKMKLKTRFSTWLASALLLAASPALAQGYPSAKSGGGLMSRLAESIEESVAEGADALNGAPLYAQIDLTGSISEKGVASGFTMEPPKSLRSVLFKLRELKEDDDVAGVIVRLDGLRTGSGKLQEIRIALEELAAEKPVHVFSNSMGLGAYYLASAGTDVTAAPSTKFFFNGLGADLLYLRRMLEKMGIEAQVVRVGKYKGALEPFTNTEASEATREAYGAVIDSIFEEIATGISESRGIGYKTVEALMSVGFMSADEALEADLIDYSHNEPEFLERIANELGEEFAIEEVDFGGGSDLDASNPFEFFSLLMGESKKSEIKENTIAMVYLSGNIIDGPPEDAALESEYISAYPTVKLLEELRLEENIVGVVLRIDSGGGSAGASDRIWSAIRRLSEEKPVVASMSDVAASGGYYIAAGADEIIANPLTITGSIGVIGGKFVMNGLYDWIGFDYDEVTRGRTLNPFDPTRSWTHEEQRMLTDLIEDTYDVFIERIISVRGGEYEDIHELAQGRIWSGRDAKEIGLIDDTGGLIDAFQRVKVLAELDPDAKYPLEIYPHRLSLAEILEKTFGGFGSNLGPLGQLRGALGPIVQALPPGFLRHVETFYGVLSTEHVALMTPEFAHISLP